MLIKDTSDKTHYQYYHDANQLMIIDDEKDLLFVYKSFYCISSSGNNNSWSYYLFLSYISKYLFTLYTFARLLFFVKLFISSFIFSMIYTDYIYRVPVLLTLGSCCRRTGVTAVNYKDTLSRFRRAFNGFP